MLHLKLIIIWFIVLKANGMINWMVILREAKIVLKVHQILIRPHIEYYTQVWT